MSARPLRLDPAYAMPPMPQSIGKYRIERVLGEGAMGVVYKGVDPLIGRPVAIKTIRRALLAAPQCGLSATGRFRQEAQAAGRLNHPGIVSIYEYGEDDGGGHDAYIAMEYVEGVPLLDATSRGVRPPLPDVLSLMLQLLDALQHAHAQGVWHRDIKPGNLIVTADGRLKVTDFGIARLDSADETQRTSALGSPGYMAPERYTGEPPDARVDVFSCGVLLYELLAGAPPFLGPGNAVMYQVLHVDPPPPSAASADASLPRVYDAIVAKAMAKRRADRYDGVAALRHALVEATAGPIAPAMSAAAVARLRSARVAAPPALERTLPAPIDTEALRPLEALLAPHIGPIARAVVRREARHCSDLGALAARLAHDWVGPHERNAFMARASALVAPAHSGAASVRLAVLGTTPLASHLVEQARRVMTFHIGPIASVVVRNAAARAGTREEFVALLAQAGPDADRETLLAALDKLP
jgi:serine/threonine-protein kinase